MKKEALREDYDHLVQVVAELAYTNLDNDDYQSIVNPIKLLQVKLLYRIKQLQNEGQKENN